MTSYGSIPVKKRHRVHLVGMNVPMQAKCALFEPLYSRARLRGRPQPSQPPRALRHGAAAPGDAVPGHPEAQMPDCSPAAKGFGSEDLSEEKICHQVALWGGSGTRMDESPTSPASPVPGQLCGVSLPDLCGMTMCPNLGHACLCPSERTPQQRNI